MPEGGTAAKPFPCSLLSEYIYADACFSLNSDLVTQSAAETACQGLTYSSHLASIHSWEEGHFLETTFPPLGHGAWIGLMDDLPGLGWTDGTPVDYVTNGTFAQASPALDCYSIGVGDAWTENPCTVVRSSICRYAIPFCDGIRGDRVDLDVCSGHGVCESDEICVCSSPAWTGTYCDQSSAVECQNGYTCAEGVNSTTLLTACGRGYYCYNGSKSVCPEGSYCPGESEYFPLDCGLGHVCSGPQLELPEICPSGQYCPDVNSSSASLKECEEGYYCVSGSIASRGQTVSHPSTSFFCEEGFYCPAGSKLPIGSGRCDSGYSCPSGSFSSTQELCPEGFFCVHGLPVLCPNGTYGPGLSVRSQCALCPGGRYCDSGTDPVTPPLCDSGYFCPPGSEGSRGQRAIEGFVERLCCEGSFCPVGSVSCLGNGTCADGYFCPAGSSSDTESLCSEGHYCVSGLEFECPNGTTSGVGSAVRFECDMCPPGKFCNSATGSLVMDDCYGGYFCPLGSSSGDAVECPEGFFCSEGVGTPSVCSDGYYCPAGSVSATEEPCPDGFFCASGLRFACPNGTFGVGSGFRTSCLSCPAGSLCENASSIVACPAGYFCPERTTSVPFECPEGYCCPEGTSSSLSGGSCVDGYLCPAGSSNCTAFPCPEGFFCIGGLGFPCPGGLVGFGPAVRSECGLCPAGFFCSSATSVSVCPSGGYCPTATAFPVPCPSGRCCAAGTNSSDTSAVCAPGYSCPEGSSSCTAELCPAGSYCLDGGVFSCALGRLALSPAVRTECVLCPAGSLCSSPTSISTCPAGYFCPSGTSIIGPGLLCPAGYSCPAGTNSSTGGGTCASGYNCPPGSTAATQEPCPPRYFCWKGLSTICPDGSYANTTAVRSSCFRCPVGSYCQSGTVFSCEGTEDLSCDSGSSVPLPCPPDYRCVDGFKELIEKEILEKEIEEAEEEAREEKAAKQVWMGATVGTYSLIGSIVGVVLLSICCVFLICCYFRLKHRKPMVPTSKTLIFAFTDIMNSTVLHNRFPDQMHAALMLHDQLARSLFSKYNVYEIKTIGDAFFVCFLNPEDAIGWCSEFQIELMRVAWPERLLSWSDCSEVLVDASESDVAVDSVLTRGGFFRRRKRSIITTTTTNSISSENGQPQPQKFLFRGLRVRIGLHVGKEFTSLYNRTWQTYDFVGRTVNKCARVESCAKPGQILVSGALFRRLEDFLSKNEDRFLSESAGLFRLKGFQGRHMLHSIYPQLLRERAMTTGRGADGNDAGPGLAPSCSADSLDSQDDLFSPVSASDVSFAVASSLLSSPDPDSDSDPTLPYPTRTERVVSPRMVASPVRGMPRAGSTDVSVISVLATPRRTDLVDRFPTLDGDRQLFHRGRGRGRGRGQGRGRGRGHPQVPRLKIHPRVAAVELQSVGSEGVSICQHSSPAFQKMPQSARPRLRESRPRRRGSFTRLRDDEEDGQ